MKKILITGVTGFVGKHFARHLFTQGSYDVVGTYRSKAGLPALGSLTESISLVQLDLHDEKAVESVILAEKPDYICHLAAQASPSESFISPVETLTNNIIAELSLLEVLKKHKLMTTRVLIISTGEIYGMVTPADLPVDEETPLRPASPYAVSKIAQDYLALQYHLSYNLDIVRVRPYNHIGPGQKAGYVVADFAKQIAEIEKGIQKPVITVGNLNAKRDFTDVRDMVRAYELVLQKGKSGDVYNIGSGESHAISAVLEQLVTLSPTNVTVSVDQSRFRPADVPEIVCDSSKVRQVTGWKPEIVFEKTLQDILDYWRKIV
jgi:GDP-4-dehydro-6-deoxy-D-mannose reductase